MPREQQFEERIIQEGMARALWVHAYMIWATEVEAAPVMGGSWEEMAPDNATTRAASKQAAKALSDLVDKANRLGDHPLAKLFGRVTRRWDADRAYAFGEDVAHICMGTRDAADSALPFTRDLMIPHFSVELDDDGKHISWDGGWTWNGNACNPCRHNGDELEILVVEDDKDLKKMYPRLIRKIFPAAEVSVVDNYHAAIGYLESHPDIGYVISDVNIIGQKTGIDVFEWVQANRPELVDKYVFVTGGNPQVEQMHYRYLEKPLSGAEQLREMIFRERPGAARTTSRRDLRPARTQTRTSVAPPRRAAPSRPPATVVPPPLHQARQLALDAAAIARLVNDALPSIRSTPSTRTDRDGRPYDLGRYASGEKVFISALWRAAQRDPRVQAAHLTLPQFKALLVDANRHRLLNLARADLVGAMDPEEVKTSEISDHGAEFHFVLDPAGWQRNPPRRRRAPAPAEDNDEDPEDLTEEDHRVLDEVSIHRARPTNIVVTPALARRLVMLRKVAGTLSEENGRSLTAAIDRSLSSGKLDERAHDSLEMWSDEDLREL